MTSTIGRNSVVSGLDPRCAPVGFQLMAGPEALFDPSLRWGYLSNGAGYLIIENHAAPAVSAVAIIPGGSGSESWASQGASHFLEHLLFNGTSKRTQEQIYDAMDLLGTYNNASTRNTHVVFMILSPAEHFWNAFEVQTDMLFHSTLPAEKLEKERGIILEELARDLSSPDHADARIARSRPLWRGGLRPPHSWARKRRSGT